MKNKYYRVIGLGLSTGLSALTAQAQTGPGGVSAVGTATNLKLWLRADQGVFSDAGTTIATNGQTVQQWADFSGNGKVGYNAVIATRPTYSTTAGANGLPTLTFNPVLQQTIASGLDITPAAMSDITVISVAKTNSSAAAYAKIWGHDNPGATGFHRSVGMDPRITNTLGYFAGTGVYNYGNVTANNYFISTASYSATTFTGYLNSSFANSGAVTCNGGLTSVSIGSVKPGDEFWNGTISEFIIFNKVLNTAERKLTEAYLGAKYNIAVASDPYTMDDPANGDFDFEVAGIGADASGSVTAGQGSGIVQVSAASTLLNTRYFMFGHNNGALTMTGPNRPAGTNSRVARTWRASELTGDVGTMTITFNIGGISGAPANASDYLLAIDRNNDGSFADETQGGSGVITAASRVGNIVTFNGVNIADAQRFTFAFTNTVALPLDLRSFTAAASGAENQIRWETANEKSVTSMEVQKSSDGVEFRKLSARDANGSGFYATIDAVPGTITYYRLRVVNQDGSQSFSSIEKVVRQNTSGALRISPNPASTVARISGLPGTEASIRLYDASGKLVLEKNTSDISLELSMSNYPAGTYNLTVDAEGFHSTQRVVKR